MAVLLEAMGALMGAVLLLCLGWALFGRLLTPVGELGGSVVLLVVGRGSGRGLEQTLSCLAWLRGRDLAGCPVLLVDAGLDEEGRRRADLLCRRWPAVELCTPEELPRRLQTQSPPVDPGEGRQ